MPTPVQGSIAVEMSAIMSTWWPWVIGVIMCLVFILYFWLFQTQLRMQRHYEKQGLRGPPFIPLLGALAAFEAVRNVDGDVALWTTFVRTHGALSFYHFGPQFRLAVADADMVKGILVTNAQDFTLPRIIKELLEPVLGNGLVLSEGATWRQHRILIAPAFHHSRLRSFMPLMWQCAGNTLAAWNGNGSNSCNSDGAYIVVDVHTEMSALTLDIIGRAVLGGNISLGSSSSVHNALNGLL